MKKKMVLGNLNYAPLFLFLNFRPFPAAKNEKHKCTVPVSFQIFINIEYVFGVHTTPLENHFLVKLVDRTEFRGGLGNSLAYRACSARVNRTAPESA